jgi:VWFA-related protein
LLAADAGETALVSFSDDVKVHQDFTSNPDILAHGLRMLRKEGIDGRMLDALGQASSLLERRSPERRRIILMIAEKRDRSSRAKLSEVLGRLQRINAAVYWLTYSPLLEPFTVRPKTVEDLKPEAERIRVRQCMLCPPPDDTPVPADLGPGSPTYGIRELARLQQPDLSSLFTETLGGRLSSFLTKNALERAIHLVSDEVHAQYVLSFEPRGGESGTFHTIRVAVKNRPGVEIRARAGYWAL